MSESAPEGQISQAEVNRAQSTEEAARQAHMIEWMTRRNVVLRVAINKLEESLKLANAEIERLSALIPPAEDEDPESGSGNSPEGDSEE